MPRFSRITHDPRLFGGKATIRGMRLTVAALLRRLAHGERPEDLLRDYPELTLGTSGKPWPTPLGGWRRKSTP